ncbi:MAG: F0F1 ATP synthase subunit delta [Lautropia sp.]|nr:F0F1 ATP synthase subunit delta [Lautropia sp.]
MAEALTIARPYAEAAFKLAAETASLAEWSDALSRLTQVMKADAAQDLLDNPKIDRARAAAIVSEAAGPLGPQQRNFVQVLAENGRLGFLPDISALFEESRNKHDGVLEVRIDSAFPLNDKQVADIVKALEARFGKGIKATTTVNPELIGGVSIQIGDEVIDASVRGKLAQLATTLTK